MEVKIIARRQPSPHATQELPFYSYRKLSLEPRRGVSHENSTGAEVSLQLCVHGLMNFQDNNPELLSLRTLTQRHGESRLGQTGNNRMQCRSRFVRELHQNPSHNVLGFRASTYSTLRLIQSLQSEVFVCQIAP